MITVYHKKSKVTDIVSTESHNFFNEINRNITKVLLDLSNKFDNEILVWCHETHRDNLNVVAINDLFHHQKFLFSFNPTTTNYFNKELGYAEDSPFVKLNKEVRYATWQMSSHVGAVHTSVVKACKNDLNPSTNFDYFLNSFAKRAMVFGLFCYSEPALLITKSSYTVGHSSNRFTLFRFIKQHYRVRWIFILFFNLLIYERRFSLAPFLYSFFYKKRTLNPLKLNKIILNSTKKIIEKGTIDVLLPTIGRKDYLFEVLKNLASQTYLPTTIIIVEQNPDKKSTSELDYLKTETWPFAIKHHFTHQAGACNARNIGLSFIESEFVFFADDDIVFENNLLDKAMESFQSTGNEVLLISCHLKTQIISIQSPKQFPIFGGGHAFVKSTCLKGLKFNMAYEFGFGEDGDFGLQLMNKGFDILLISTSEIIHLKAPIGGFRTKPKLRWDEDGVQPKPSPTVMFYKLCHSTKEQLLCYKTILFFKNVNSSFFKNPIGYIKMFNKKWNRSVHWANELNKL